MLRSCFFLVFGTLLLNIFEVPLHEKAQQAFKKGALPRA
jgi:hypothetical protein